MRSRYKSALISVFFLFCLPSWADNPVYQFKCDSPERKNTNVLKHDIAFLDALFTGYFDSAKRQDLHPERKTFEKFVRELCPSDSDAAMEAFDKLAATSVDNVISLLEAKIEYESQYRKIRDLESEWTALQDRYPRANFSISDYRMRRIKKASEEAFLTRQETCKGIDLREKSDLLRKPRNQGGRGWCYAYAAADMISYRLGQMISAIDLVRTYLSLFSSPSKLGAFLKDKLYSREIKYLDPNKNEGGIVEKAINAAIAKGVCLEENLPTTTLLESKELPLNEPQKMEFFNLLDSLTKISSNYRSKLSDVNSCRLQTKELLDSYQFQDLGNMQRVVDKILGAKNQRSVIKTFVKNRCDKNRIHLDETFRVQSINYSGDTAPLFAEIDKQLSAEQIVGVDLNSQTLENPLLLNEREGNPHSVTVIGRRFNQISGSCDYLIKNTHGGECNYENNECDKTDGSVWLKEPDLRRGIHSVRYFVHMPRARE